eukprot:CAMPEP_0198619872 /NCGR_PEP_ID=MMETSP1462-20131121/161607_1 /TAXON_ID=1333877 /ORGANISM="Brandtodinium nutriculum, Strain RCC3387" /LENGTH=218 /DNA_ID=CAMNT_0044351671 /DNA_START=856 /DNA_END=1509 /DNA_ORIENTATION=+
MSVSRRHIVGAKSLYHWEYIRHYTGILPVFLPATLLDALRGISYSPSRPEFIWRSHRSLPPGAPPNLIKPQRYNHVSELTAYRGAVVLPYSVNSGKVVELYAMNIPLFLPTIRFGKQFMNDRTAVGRPYCPKFTAESHPKRHPTSPYNEWSPNSDSPKDIEFWMGFQDELNHWPCVEHFDSWDELYVLVRAGSKRLRDISACMKQANKWRRFEELQNW